MVCGVNVSTPSPLNQPVNQIIIQPSTTSQQWNTSVIRECTTTKSKLNPLSEIYFHFKFVHKKGWVNKQSWINTSKVYYRTNHIQTILYFVLNNNRSCMINYSKKPLRNLILKQMQRISYLLIQLVIGPAARVINICIKYI